MPPGIPLSPEQLPSYCDRKYWLTPDTLMPKLGKKTGRPARPPMIKAEEQSIVAELFWSIGRS
jgi:hypothetical protein